MHAKFAMPIAAVAILAAGLTACTGPTTVSTKPVATKAAGKGGSSGKSAKPADKKSADKREKEAGIGDTISLHGMDDGSRIDVTLVKWVDPAKSSDEFMAPEKGKRWVAAQLRLTNTGTAVYSDSPGNGLTVTDGDGQQFQTTFGEVTAGPAMSSDLRLTKGAKGLGWVVFEVPKASKITKLQMALDSGFADETGQWNIK
ncbi:DUF4352 domain-containing protein [Streptomyces sp. NPDC058864]